VIGRHIDGIANGTLRMSPALRKQSGTKDGPAPTQARNCRKVLRQILSLAVKDEAIPTNPTLQLDRIRGGRRPPRALTLQQVQQLRVAVSSWCSSGSGQSGRPRDSQLVEIVELLLATGMRIGEVLALRAEDVELASDIPFVRIRGTVVSIAGRGAVRKPSPKTPHSQADVALPEFGVIALKRALARQAEIHGAVSLVFSTLNNTPIQPNNVRRSLRDALADAGLSRAEQEARGEPPIHPHVLRKTVASQLGVERGSQQLRHTDQRITLAHYIEPSRELINNVSLLQEVLAPTARHRIDDATTDQKEEHA
jgi:integrase